MIIIESKIDGEKKKGKTIYFGKRLASKKSGLSQFAMVCEILLNYKMNLLLLYLYKYRTKKHQVSGKLYCMCNCTH